MEGKDEREERREREKTLVQLSPLRFCDSLVWGPRGKKGGGRRALLILVRLLVGKGFVRVEGAFQNSLSWVPSSFPHTHGDVDCPLEGPRSPYPHRGSRRSSRLLAVLSSGKLTVFHVGVDERERERRETVSHWTLGRSCPRERHTTDE